jgi:CubicO group peptidase (beta-lactamase class C family)
MNKMFTAVAIAQLAEQGRLAYADPIAKFLGGDWIALDAAQRITIEHLLTHSSGLGSYFTDQFLAASRERFRVIDDYKPLVRGERPAFEPGSEWSYSNTGYLLLGAIIEKVTGGSYYDYVREHICSPAGMNDTDCYDMDKVVPNLAIGYTREPGASGQPEWTTNAFKHVIRGGPAGGGFSTVRDLHRFDRALRTGKLVSAKTTELMWSPKPASPQYGYGFGLEGAPGARIVGHSGGFPGISAKLNMYLDSGYTLAVLSNYDQGAMVVEQKVGELLARLK